MFAHEHLHNVFLFIHNNIRFTVTCRTCTLIDEVQQRYCAKEHCVGLLPFQMMILAFMNPKSKKEHVLQR